MYQCVGLLTVAAPCWRSKAIFSETESPWTIVCLRLDLNSPTKCIQWLESLFLYLFLWLQKEGRACLQFKVTQYISMFNIFLDDAKIREQVNAILFILFPIHQLVTSLPALCTIYMQEFTETAIQCIQCTWLQSNLTLQPLHSYGPLV